MASPPQCAQKNKDLFSALHCRCMGGQVGERHDPPTSPPCQVPSSFKKKKKHNNKKTPVTVPTDEPYFLCSASWWQSELFSSFVCFRYHFSRCHSAERASPQFHCQEARKQTTGCFRVRFRPFLEVLVPTRSPNRVTLTFTRIIGSVNGKPCLYSYY